MNTVKPTKQYSMMVVPYRPFRRFFFIFGLALTFLVAIAGSFVIGSYYSGGNNGDLLAEHNALTVELQEKTSELAKAEQQVANLKLAAEVDRKANEEVRSEVVQLKTKVAELEQDNSFYRGLMRPVAGDKGLVLDPPSIEITGRPGVYNYSLVVKQIVARHQRITGFLEFELIGQQAGAPRRLALEDVSSSISVERIKLSFKYFQRVEGEMVLPQGFTPERIEIKVVAEKPRRAQLDKKFGWLVKES